MAKDSGMAIKYVVDTHVHADHVSSGRDLAREAGAEYVLHANTGASYEHRARPMPRACAPRISGTWNPNGLSSPVSQ